MKEVSVLLVGNYLIDQQQSMQRYAELLKSELSARGHAVELVRPEPCLGRLRAGTSGLGKWFGYVDKFILFPLSLRRKARKIPNRVVHICDHSNAMYTAFLRGVPNIVTCHDLLAIRSALGHFPQNRTGWTGRRLQSWIVRGLRSAQRIICVSAETRRQLLSFEGFAGKSVVVVANGLNHPYHVLTKEDSKERFALRPELFPLIDKRYVFFVGGYQWYKNRAGMLRIYVRYAMAHPKGVDLVMAGKPLTQELDAIIQEAPESVRARILHVGSPDNEGLHALYARAEGLFFPSLEEGFGWPIIEAMSAGCRVLTSNRPPMNEIGGDAAMYLDPAREAAAAEVLAEFLGEDPNARAVRTAASLAQASRFSTAAMVDGMLVNYQEVLGK